MGYAKDKQFEEIVSELEELKKLVITAMQLEQPLKVPLDVDVNFGKNWKEN